MAKKFTNKIAIILSILVLAGAVAVPFFAKADKDNGLPGAIRNFQRGERGVENSVFRTFSSIMSNMVQARDRDNDNDDNTAVSASWFFNSSAFRTARQAHNQAIRNANQAYNTARKAAHSKFISALNSATDQASRFAALKTYLMDLLSAIKVRDSAKQAALQAFIDAVSNIQVNQAPTADSQNVTLSKNTSKAITLTGSDPQGLPLSFFVVTNPAHGTLSGTAPTLTYFPNTDFTGTDSFMFKVNDGVLASPLATVSMTVNP